MKVRTSPILVAVVAIGMYAAQSLQPQPSYGERVSVEVAAELYGGACGDYGFVDCPGNPDNPDCVSGSRVTGSGDEHGKAVGDIKCSSSCGSYFDDVDNCGS
jgi:hypothetical protein